MALLPSRVNVKSSQGGGLVPLTDGEDHVPEREERDAGSQSPEDFLSIRTISLIIMIILLRDMWTRTVYGLL